MTHIFGKRLSLRGGGKVVGGLGLGAEWGEGTTNKELGGSRGDTQAVDAVGVRALKKGFKGCGGSLYMRRGGGDGGFLKVGFKAGAEAHGGGRKVGGGLDPSLIICPSKDSEKIWVSLA